MFPGLSKGCINTVLAHGTEELKEAYAHKLVAGEWTGTMCLTEPQCGSDLAQVGGVGEWVARYLTARRACMICFVGRDDVRRLTPAVLSCLDDSHQVTTKAEPQEDGSYKITGTKIFISCGDHDMAENIVHCVLARLPGAPEGPF